MSAPVFVVDTVGNITNPAGETFKGVILGLPAGLTDAEEKAAMQAVARLWSERIQLRLASTDPA